MKPRNLILISACGLLLPFIFAWLAFFSPWALFAVILSGYASLIIAGCLKHHEANKANPFRAASANPEVKQKSVNI